MEKSLENCKEHGGKVKPIVNLNNCGGKEDCVIVCPFDVFEIRVITAEDKGHLNLKGKIKTLFNAQKAYVVNAEACHACGLCVTACPERAIKLQRA